MDNYFERYADATIAASNKSIQETGVKIWINWLDAIYFTLQYNPCVIDDPYWLNGVLYSGDNAPFTEYSPFFELG